ncbi:MAG TPA: HD domain-containing protein [Anaerolineae bacterium]|nr:HD domain-containing protein [Anaerolineae bacterium]
MSTIQPPTKTKPTWPKQLRQAMKQATKQEAIRRYGTLDPNFNYRWEHVQAVVTVSRKLAQLTGADTDIVVAAAWLHDIRKDAGDDHPKAGAKYAREFLPTTDFPPEKIERVAKAIAQHMGLWRQKPLTNLESMVLWDADKLTKIGLTAAFHWLGGDLAKPDTKRTTESFIKKGKAVDWQHKTVASMHTEPARRAAQARIESYRQLWENLHDELEGNDLF